MKKRREFRVGDPVTFIRISEVYHGHVKKVTPNSIDPIICSFKHDDDEISFTAEALGMPFK
mgnify:CR=1 FL=1